MIKRIAGTNATMELPLNPTVGQKEVNKNKPIHIDNPVNPTKPAGIGEPQVANKTTSFEEPETPPISVGGEMPMGSEKPVGLETNKADRTN